MAEEKRRENIEQGKGISISRALGSRSTNYEFSTSNPLWRSSLEVLDFVPLNTVDYAGGIIITDWYSTDKNQSIKISIQFLTNEVTANSLKIIVFQKNCESNLDCKTTILNSKIKEELSSTIIKKAAILEKSSLKK